MIAWNTPVYNALKTYARSGPVAFHMPGHKLGKGIPVEFLRDIASIDVTEIPGTDNLHAPSGVIREAQELAAKAFGADETLFLVNGSTCGIHAMIMACCRPGDRLIVSRDCHRSVIGGMMLAGAEPIYIKPGFDSRYGITTVIDPAELEEILKKHPDAAGVLITRPNYYGVCSDMHRISDIVHSHGKVLLVDEAHGAHLGFCSSLPAGAMEGGADICVQSAHKTLPAFTQGAYLHVKSGRVDRERLKFILRTIQTTSPSYVIMAMLDIARELMEKEGTKRLDALLRNIRQFKRQLGGLQSIAVLSEEGDADGVLDETRLTVNFQRMGMTGFEADRLLRSECNIQVEMADLYNIVCIATVADEKKDLERLLEGLLILDRRFGAGLPGSAEPEFGGFSIPTQKLGLKEALSRKTARVELNKAAGRISGSIITPYPPGIPLICPGEVIGGDTVDYILYVIRSGGIVQGIGDRLCVDVIA